MADASGGPCSKRRTDFDVNVAASLRSLAQSGDENNFMEETELLVKLIVAKLTKNSTAIHGTMKFITLTNRVRHLTSDFTDTFSAHPNTQFFKDTF